MSSSIPFVCFNQTIEQLKECARQKLLHAQNKDKIIPIREKSIVGRLGRMDPALDGKERGFDKPGLTVTYMGMKGNPADGDFCTDHRVVQILVQLVDSTDEGDATHAETYFFWMTAVREWLQANPYNEHTGDVGQVYLVHVTDESLPDEQKWAVDREMRMFLMVNCFCRMRRTKDQREWQST